MEDSVGKRLSSVSEDSGDELGHGHKDVQDIDMIE
jgi:hypothetical protein